LGRRFGGDPAKLLVGLWFTGSAHSALARSPVEVIMSTPARPLCERKVLAIDCQTTGATPHSGRLLEVGWAAVRAVSTRSVPLTSYLLRLPDGHDLPGAVQRLTGIQPHDMALACDHRIVWRRLAETARHIRIRSGAPCLAVIHFALFERRFLEPWHSANAPGTPMPFEIICTHRLARKLMPGLPRCGLRALAGYFGLRLPTEKRCAPHVAATVLIWKRLVVCLQERGITDLAALKRWLQSDSRPAQCVREYPMPQSRRCGVPDRPGVYRFRRSNGDLLYIGKAKSLKRRVGSYFQRRRRHPEHILEMLTQAIDLDYSPTATALEAALREAEDIRRLLPEYNIQLKPGLHAPVFASRDLQQAGSAGNGVFPMGPFPSRRALQPLATLVRALTHNEYRAQLTETEMAQALGLPMGISPPRDIFYAGLRLFRKQNDLPQAQTALVRRLLRCGADWWLPAPDTAREDAFETLEQSRPDEDWTPGSILVCLASITRQGAFFVRRGRWLNLLSEATIGWERPQENAAATLSVSHGRVSPSACIPDTSALLPPNGWRRTPRQRRSCFDAATYMRLRVLTTEIRRLVSDGRRVTVCLRPNIFLDREALIRLLSWV
jgi:DNA polymerase-3 subunit epsilon